MLRIVDGVKEASDHLKAVAKDLILQVLGDLGAHTDDLETWKLEMKGKAILMEGLLSQNGLRRVFSIRGCDRALV